MLYPTASMRPERNVHPAYRPDIDGLRAVAILSVVAYHAFPGAARGGYVGVDVFFVISGYLISSIIFRSLERGDFAFGEFYRHRVARIFPALIVVLAASLAFGWFALLPGEFERLGKHAAAGAAFVQNVVITREAGYFNPATDTKPLMHLWSLAIEEQFYLAYPLAVWAAWRLRFGVLALALVAGLASFAANVLGVRSDPDATFFLAHTRFWELMTGSLLAQLAFRRTAAQSGSPAARALRDGGLAGLGIVLVAVAVFATPPDADFPGWWALPPVMGAALLIAAGPQAWVNRTLLANKAMVFVGLVSYPLYLWHWPLLSYARIVESELPSPAFRLVLVAASLALATLTYRFVERPLRSARRSWILTAILTGSIAAVGYLGFEAYRREGVPSREVARLQSAIDTGRFYGAQPFRQPGCGATPEQMRLLDCEHDARGKARFALVGDSKAGALAAGVFGESTPSGYWIFVGGNDVDTPGPPLVPEFPEFQWFQPAVRPALDLLARNRDIEVVVVTAATRSLFGLGTYTSIEALPAKRNFDAVVAGFGRVVDELVRAGKKVVLTVDNPTLLRPQDCIRRTTSLPLANRVIGGRFPAGCSIALDRHLELSAQYRRMLEAVAARHPGEVFVFDTLPDLCDVANNLCAPSIEGRFLYGYTDHVSEYGAHRTARRLVPFVERLAARAR